MAIFHSCLCWRDVKTGCVASAIFSMTLSFVQILLQIVLWTSHNDPKPLLDYLPYRLYIPLAGIDFLMVLFNMTLLVALEMKQRGRYLLLPWIIIAILYIGYEIAINAYFLYFAFPYAIAEHYGRGSSSAEFEPLFTDQSNILVQLIVLVVYWGLKVIFYMLAILCVIACYQELTEQKKKRTKKSLPPSQNFEGPSGNYLNSMPHDGHQRGGPVPSVHSQTLPAAAPPYNGYDDPYRERGTGYDRYEPPRDLTPYARQDQNGPGSDYLRPDASGYRGKPNEPTDQSHLYSSYQPRRPYSTADYLRSGFRDRAYYDQ